MNKYIINGRFLTQKLTGVHRYAFEMCCALHKEGFKFIVMAPPTVLPDYECPFEVKTVGWFSSHIWEQFVFPFYVRRYYPGSVVINFTGLGSLLNKKNICTIHDLSFLENPSWFSKSYYYLYSFLTPLVAKSALKIITVSEFSRDEIVRKIGLHKDKIVVIYNAVSEKLVNKNCNNFAHEGNFFLSVSSVDPRKNQTKLVEAYKLLNRTDYKLYFVGKKSKVFRNHNALDEEDPNIIYTGYLTDSELVGFYRNAAVFIYPSLYEGFGIPNLEAMVNSCPVITSSIPPHLEVCNDAVLYFNPNDATDIAEKMKQIINNPSLKSELITKGQKRVKHFSWENSAKKLIVTLTKEGL